MTGSSVIVFELFVVPCEFRPSEFANNVIWPRRRGQASIVRIVTDRNYRGRFSMASSTIISSFPGNRAAGINRLDKTENRNQGGISAREFSIQRNFSATPKYKMKFNSKVNEYTLRRGQNHESVFLPALLTYYPLILSDRRTFRKSFQLTEKAQIVLP